MAAHLRPHRRAVTLIVLLQLLQTTALLFLPTLNAEIIDEGVVKGDTARIVRVGGVMLAVTLVQAAATLAAVLLSARTAMAVGRDIRAAVFDRVQRFSAREMGWLGVSTLITRTTNDVQQIQLLLLSALTLIVTAPVLAVGAVVMAVGQDVTLSLLLLALIPVLGVLVTHLIRRMRPLSRAMQGRIDAVNRVLREQITGIRVVRAFVKDEAERARFTRVNTELADVSVRLGRVSTTMLPLVINTVNLFSVAVVWVGALRIDSGDMRIGALTAFLTYLVMLEGAVLGATFVITQLPRAEVCAARVDEVLRTEPSVAPPAAPVAAFEHPGRVELRGVRFTYPDAEADVLHDVDLLVAPGSTTAIVGSTGSGKSTVIGLICRLFDPTAGQVLVGGVDIRSIDPALLSETVGLVPQKPYLFSGTIASNLRYGRPDATEEELWRALETAQARDFVERMDGGLHAAVAQGGSTVSGGQRQRLAIARALVRRPRVYLFDDSFSALDHATDAAVRQALAADTAGATVVVVAQRVTSILDADQIVVLDEGRVVGTGTHQQLLDRSPVYRQIVTSQLGEEGSALPAGAR